MYFQIIDNNKKCLKMYALDDYMDYRLVPNLNKTWKHSEHLSDNPGGAGPIRLYAQDN